MTISRFDLIAAGADFTLLKSEHRAHLYDDSPGEKWQMKSCPSRKTAQICYEKSFDPDFLLAEFHSDCAFKEVRMKVATFIESIDHQDAEALRAPWASHANTGWPDPRWAFKEGLNLNALLYSAAQHSNSIAAQMYLDAGANPLSYIYDGDCAARIGVANSMIKVFNRPEWLNAATKDTGETGLHWLAANSRCIDVVKMAIQLGADADQCDCDGNSALDLIISERAQNDLFMTIVEARAKRLREDTVEALPSVICSGLRARRL